MPDSLGGRLGSLKRPSVIGSDVDGDSTKGSNTAGVSPLPKRGACAVSSAIARTGGNKRMQTLMPICAQPFSRPYLSRKHFNKKAAFLIPPRRHFRHLP